MPGIEGADPSPNEIAAIRNEAIKKLNEIGLDNINSTDLVRLESSDEYVQRFFKHVFHLPGNQLDEAVNCVVQTFIWRNKFGVDNININTINKEFFKKGAIYTHNRDKDGKLILIFEVNKHIKGVDDMDEIKQFFIFLLERIDREEQGERKLSILFNCAGCGLKNVDMTFIPWMINTFKFYYPWIINYILVLDLPWILNATWGIIKNLLPGPAQKVVKFVTKKDIVEYLDRSKYMEAWGGEDSWAYSPEAEIEAATSSYVTNSSHPEDRDDREDSFASLPVGNFTRKKSVKFAELKRNESESSLQSQESDESCLEGPLLIEPSDNFEFHPAPGGTLYASVRLINQSHKPVAFKIKATSPETYRTKPSSGIIPGGDAAVVEMQVAGEEGRNRVKVGWDRFLVTAINVEKEYLPYNQLQQMLRTTRPDVKHRMGCVLAKGKLTNILNNHSQDQYETVNGKLEKLERLCEVVELQRKKSVWLENVAALFIAIFVIVLMLWAW